MSCKNAKRKKDVDEVYNNNHLKKINNMANKDDLNITLDSILEMLSEVKETLKTKNDALSKEDKSLLQQILETSNQQQNDIGIEPDDLLQLKTTISEMKDIMEKPAMIKNQYTIDISSSKNFLIIIGLTVGLIFSVFGNYFQFNDNERLTDNDLKYRFIKMINGVDSTELYNIEHTFIYERDEKVIDNIRKTVVDYEQKIIEHAEVLERARMKEDKAKKLLMEAEELKNK